MWDQLPIELLENIFVYLSPKDLCACRAVCWKWKHIVDNLTRQTTLWRQHCQRDYPSIWHLAYQNSKPGLSWYFLYKSLSLWPKLPQARIIKREFAFGEHYNDIIIDFFVLSNGVIGVHRTEAIVYYDLHTLRKSKREKIIGRYKFYRENDNIILTVDNENSLTVTWKVTEKCSSKLSITSQDVTSFFLVDDTAYYSTLIDDVYSCTLIDGKVVTTKLTTIEDGVASIGSCNGEVYIVTKREILVKLVKNEFIQVVNLRELSFVEIFKELRKYDFHKEILWAFCSTYYAYFKYRSETMFVMPFCDVTIIYPYGHILFSGSELGNLFVYYVPNHDVFFNMLKIRHFNLSDESEYLSLGLCRIRRIHVVESYNSHIILIATPHKICSLKFIH